MAPGRTQSNIRTRRRYSATKNFRVARTKVITQHFPSNNAHPSNNVHPSNNAHPSKNAHPSNNVHPSNSAHPSINAHPLINTHLPDSAHASIVPYPTAVDINTFPEHPVVPLEFTKLPGAHGFIKNMESFCLSSKAKYELQDAAIRSAEAEIHSLTEICIQYRNVVFQQEELHKNECICPSCEDISWNPHVYVRQNNPNVLYHSLSH
ncbi:hypothetical protein F5879DRAFT_988042 [Lentinula edodes]|nr:hypothetical protein F5879DRAFT_988042 [Lentinula edodes]